MKLILILGLVLSTQLSLGSDHILGNAKAPQGGEFVIGFPAYPKAMLFYLGFDEPSEFVNGFVMESLVDRDLETYEFIPLIAKEWKISDDKKTFTFILNPEAKFSDGKPITSKDVKFTWDTILNPKNKTAPFQSVYSSIESCTAVDAHTVVFKAKTLHFKNFEKLAGLMILPEHYFSKGDFNRAFNSKIMGSGPYILDSVKMGERIYLKKNPNYWGKALPQNIGRYNFDKLTLKSMPDYNVQFESFKKGDIDYFYFLSSKMWATETDGPLFQKKYIEKIKAENLIAYSTQGITWNLRKPLFQDKRVRLALSHLMNREKWIKDLFYSNYVLATGPIGTTSEFHSPKVKPVTYDPGKAKELLKEAGWNQVDSKGILVKDGLHFEFDILTDTGASQRYLTLYQEDLKKAGIKMNIRQLDWATAIKLTDDWQFDARELARGRDIEPGDFADGWGSKQADIKGSANSGGYKNPEVDKLSEEIDKTFDLKKRIPMVQKLDEIIAQDQPISMCWEATFFRLAHWNKYSYPGKGYFKYSTWKSAFQFWWLDKDKEKKLTESKAAGKSL